MFDKIRQLSYHLGRVKAAKQLENKKKREEEKAKHEDNLQQSKELLKVSDESMVCIYMTLVEVISILFTVMEDYY